MKAMTPAIARLEGVGVVSTLGRGNAANTRGLKQGQAQFQRYTLTQYKEPIEAAYLAVHPDERSPAKSELHADAASQLFDLLDSAVAEALQQSALSTEEYQQMPIFIGSSSYGIGLAEEIYQQALRQDEASAVPIPLDGFSQISGHLRRHFGMMGADFAYNTACTSSANAILSAANSISSGTSTCALVIGIESHNLTTLSGFASMQLFAREHMRPFDRRRDGLVLGEGCGALVFKAAAPDCSGLVFKGGASRCDTYSISAANPNGSSIAEVMYAALGNAGVEAEQILAIKAHGTASPLNDNGEAAGMRQVFSPVPPFFSLKAYIGHTLGSCGAIETAMIANSLAEGFLPASAGFELLDESLGVAPIMHSIPANKGYYLLNFFGFGGNNNSLVFGWQ